MKAHPIEGGRGNDSRQGTKRSRSSRPFYARTADYGLCGVLRGPHAHGPDHSGIEAVPAALAAAGWHRPPLRHMRRPRPACLPEPLMLPPPSAFGGQHNWMFHVKPTGPTRFNTHPFPCSRSTAKITLGMRMGAGRGSGRPHVGQSGSAPGKEDSFLTGYEPRRILLRPEALVCLSVCPSAMSPFTPAFHAPFSRSR